MDRTSEFMRRGAPAVLLIVMSLVVWQLWITAARVPAFLLPGPLAIANTLLADHVLLLQNALPTLETAVAGFLLALVLGVATAVAMHLSKTVELALYPITIASQTVPLIALAPVLVVLLGFGILPKLIIVCLIAYFPFVVNTVDGFRSVDPDLVAMVRSLGAGRAAVFREVEWPTALPYLFSAARVAITYSLIGALYGELAGSSEGLQFVIQQESAQMNTPAVFAAMVVLAILGICLFVVVAAAERLLLPWRRGPGRWKGRRAER